MPSIYLLCSECHTFFSLKVIIANKLVIICVNPPFCVRVIFKFLIDGANKQFTAQLRYSNHVLYCYLLWINYYYLFVSTETWLTWLASDWDQTETGDVNLQPKSLWHITKWLRVILTDLLNRENNKPTDENG